MNPTRSRNKISLRALGRSRARARAMEQLAAIPGAQPDFTTAFRIPWVHPDIAAACRNPWCPASLCNSLLGSLLFHALHHLAAILGPSRTCSSLLQSLGPSQTLQQLAAIAGARSLARLCSSLLKSLVPSQTSQQLASFLGNHPEVAGACFNSCA